MKLVQVPVPETWHLYFLCEGCGRVVDPRAVAVYADLDGEAFKTYYCAGCAEELK